MEFLEGLAFQPEELEWLARQNRFNGRTHRAAGQAALHRRHLGDSRGHGDLRQRADHPRGGAAARGTAGGNADHEHPALPDHDRQQGRARGPASARQAAGGFRPAPRPRRPRPACTQRAPLISPGCRARPPCSRGSATACRSSAPWPTRSSRRTTARCRRSRTSRAAIPTTSPC